MDDKDKGKLVALEEVNSYTECESLCDNNQDCMNFEHCPTLKTCRIFDKKIRGVEYLKQVQWYDCYGNYATCKKGTLISRNITNNSILLDYICMGFKIINLSKHSIHFLVQG